MPTFLKQNYTNSQIKRLNVAAIILDESNKVLLCQRSKTKSVKPLMWHLPGGKVEENEEILEAMSRELHEELELNLVEIKSISSNYFGYMHQIESARTIFCNVRVSGDIKLNYENESYKFVAFEDLHQYLEPEVLEINQIVVSEVLKNIQD